MIKYHGIIFDIDGTMTSTNDLILASFNHVSEKYLKKTFTMNELISLFGPTEDQILKELTGENYEEAMRDYYEFYSSKHHDLADIYPGMYELLQMVRLKEVPMAVFTGKGRQAALITLDKLGITEFFDMIITGDDVRQFKPSPEGIYQFLDKYSLPKENVLLIGDSMHDIIAAESAGIDIASVIWDSYSKDDILNSGREKVFHNVSELRKFILENIE